MPHGLTGILSGRCSWPRRQGDRDRRLLLKVHLSSINENIPFKTVYVSPTTYAGTIVQLVVRKSGFAEPPENFYLAEVYPSGGLSCDGHRFASQCP